MAIRITFRNQYLLSDTLFSINFCDIMQTRAL